MKGFRNKKFDRAASQAQLEAIKEQMNTRFRFFNDPKFIGMRLCSKENATHDNHYHIRIKPPSRIEGVAINYSLGSKVVKEAYEKMSKVASGVFESIEDIYDGVKDFFD